MLFLVPAALADDPPPAVEFVPIAEVRPRGEVRATLDGTSDPLLSVNQRTRLGGRLSAGKKVAVEIVVEDTRLWGEELDTLKDYSAGGFDIHTGALIWKPADSVGITLGRQQISFQEERLVGAVEWTPQGRHFDAARLSLTTGALSADLVGAVVLEPDALLSTEGADTLMFRGGWSPKPAIVVDALYVYDSDDHNGATERHRHTAGLYAKAGNGLISGRVEGYGQFGSNGKSSYGTHMVGAAATFSPKSTLEPKITLWFDRLSGDDDLADDRLTTFEPLYQTGHKFYGRMDLFYATPADDASGRGLHDAALKLEMAPMKTSKVNLDAHLMMKAAGQDPMLGEEVDLWWTQTYGPRLKMVAGAATFLPAGGGDPLTFGWLEIGAKY